MIFHSATSLNPFVEAASIQGAFLVFIFFIVVIVVVVVVVVASSGCYGGDYTTIFPFSIAFTLLYFLLTYHFLPFLVFIRAVNPDTEQRNWHWEVRILIATTVKSPCFDTHCRASKLEWITEPHN